MMKNKILYVFILTTAYVDLVFAGGQKPDIVGGGLPGSRSSGTQKVGTGDFFDFMGGAISLMIQYAAVIAIISLMIAGIRYMTSIGDKEKADKAKKMIIWSIVGVLISTRAWAIVNFLNVFEIR